MMRSSSAFPVISVRGVLFDMDGVLINSIASDERTWLRWARFHGMEGTFSLQDTNGRRTIDTLRLLRPDLDQQVELERIENFEAEEQTEVVALPGAEQLLASLPASAWAVVTSNSEKMMRNRLMAAGIAPPRHFISGDIVAHGKPHPESYRMAAEILALEPSECLVIEDTPPGIEGGKAAGCSVLAIVSSHSAGDLAEADWVVPSLDQVTASFESDGTITIHLSL
ncbi:MAG: HAD-IA family hydrolase [Terracidiphilus sp.]